MGDEHKISSKKDKRKVMHTMESDEGKNVSKKKKTKRNEHDTNDDFADVPNGLTKKVKSKDKKKKKNKDSNSEEDQLLISDITEVISELFDEFKKETETMGSKKVKKDKKQKEEKNQENGDKLNSHKVFNDADFVSNTSDMGKEKKKILKSEIEQSQSDIDTSYESNILCSANDDCVEGVKNKKDNSNTSTYTPNEIGDKSHMDSEHGDESLRKKKKRKKSKGQENELETNYVNDKSAGTFTPLNTDCDNKKRKKKKSDKADCDGRDHSIDCINESDDLGIEKKKRRKSKHSSEGENDINQFSQDNIVTNDNFNSKREKKKKSNVTVEMDSLVDSVGSKIEKDNTPKERKSKKAKSEITDDRNSENEMPVKKKKTSKINIENDSSPKERKNEKSEITEVQNSENEISVKKKKKSKVKIMDDLDDSVGSKIEEDGGPSPRERKSKKSKTKCEITEDQNSETKKMPVKKKRRDNETAVKIHFQESCNSPVFESEERQEKFKRLLGGNKTKGSSSTCEAGVLSTKETIVKSKDNISNKSDSMSAVSGQWSGMMFENAERQNKFIRLLGGAKSSVAAKKNGLFSSGKTTPKKGLFGSLTSKMCANGPGSGSSGGGKAMSLQAATSLNDNLENDYNRALSRRLDGTGSSGIGFVKDPAEGKTFHINTSDVKSTKFNDDDE